MTRSDPSLGDQIGRYRLIGELARGGMGIVYIAGAQGPAGFAKLVALKELRPELVRDSEFLTMFLDEARMAARLNHPNIVQTMDVSEVGGRHFIAMEYLDGRSLHHVLSRFASRGGFPQRLSLAILRDALAALDYAHELTDAQGRLLGFVHRDVSPQNIFVTFDGHTKVIDFGIAKARDSSLETKTGVLKGRANYMAPEQLTHRTDRRSDLFSMGAILYEVLSGRRLWQGMGEVEILGRLTRGEIPKLGIAHKGLPPQLVALCDRALAESPDERYATAAEMRDAIEDFLWQTGGPPRAKEIEAALASEFGAERQAMRELLERAVARMQAGEAGQLERLGLPETREPTHRSSIGHLALQPVPAHTPTPHRHSKVGAVPSQVAHTPSAVYGQSIVQPLPGIPPLPGQPPELLLPIATPSFGARLVRGLSEQRAVIGATVLGAVFIVTVLAVVLHRAPPLADPIVAAPALAVPPSAALNPPARSALNVPQVAPPETVQLSVSVAPSTAQVLIDNEAMPSNPFLGRFPRSETLHRIRATAPGYEPKERLVSFADNVVVDLALTLKPVTVTPPVREAPAREAPSARHEPPRRERERSARAPAPSARLPPPPPVVERAPAPPPPAPVVERPPAREKSNELAPREGGPRRRAIDSNNPYGDDK